MIYDCFPFFNELDLLEIRLNELDSVVDKFVLVEATKTFQKKDKPLYYEENKERFKDFEDKIIHIIVDKFPGFFYKWRIPTAWDYDNYQKDQVAQALKNCSNDDVIIISDLDEIPSAEIISKYKNYPGVKVFEQILCNYYLNCVAIKAPEKAHLTSHNGMVYWKGTVMLNYSNFSSFKNARILREQSGENIISLQKSGWHFSFVGNFQKIREKLDSWAHTNEKEYNPDYLMDKNSVDAIIKKGGDLFGRDYQYVIQPLSDIFPKYILENQNRFSNLLG